MAKYKIYDRQFPFQVEADVVAFNLDAGMIFFKTGDEVLASCPMTTPFVKAMIAKDTEEDVVTDGDD